MTLPLPNLDDRTYAEIVEEAIAQIAVEYPEWTDHNPSDTGIILIELLAWLTEMTLYRVNQIPDRNYVSFLSLLKGETVLPNSNPSSDPSLNFALQSDRNLAAEIEKTLLALRRTHRAVTSEDYEQLVLQDWNQNAPKSDRIARIKCIPQRNLERNSTAVAQGHISLIVVPQALDSENIFEQNQAGYQGLYDFLDRRRLLTTRLHILEAEYVPIEINASLVIEDGFKPEKINLQAQTEVGQFFSPISSGKYWQGTGWIFGRSVYLSELYQLLDDLEGVDYVENLGIIQGENQPQSTVKLNRNQLVKLEKSRFKIIVRVGNERKEV